ncbi:MAG: MBL fold metallo-hydrolase [Lachnospiraceae bacterium]|nr:MBL fold metallo-hydrolase [Lachnospiraceae bacterium]
MKERILNTHVNENQLALFFLGQEGFIFKTPEQKTLMIDGFLTGDLLHEGMAKGRFYEPPIRPEDLDFLDAAVFTHDHRDHLDPVTVRKLCEVNDHCSIIVPAPLAGKAVSEYGVPAGRVIPARDSEVIEAAGIAVIPVPAAHEELHPDSMGDYRELGYRFDFDGISVYHSGDCCVYDGLSERVGSADVVMLPVNGRSYYKLKSGLIGNMNLEEAVLLAKELKAKLFVPMHYDLFNYNRLPVSDIPAGIDLYGKELCFKMFRPGEKLIYEN